MSNTNQVAEYIREQWDKVEPLIPGGGKYGPIPRIECVDGFYISVQVGHCLYCTPRDDDGPWYAVECGYPSEVPEFILEHAEDPESPTETVYGYTPIELVEKLIQSHGGIKKGE